MVERKSCDPPLNELIESGRVFVPLVAEHLKVDAEARIIGLEEELKYLYGKEDEIRERIKEKCLALIEARDRLLLY